MSILLLCYASMISRIAIATTQYSLSMLTFLYNAFRSRGSGNTRFDNNAPNPDPHFSLIDKVPFSTNTLTPPLTV